MHGIRGGRGEGEPVACSQVGDKMATYREAKSWRWVLGWCSRGRRRWAGEVQCVPLVLSRGALEQFPKAKGEHDYFLLWRRVGPLSHLPSDHEHSLRRPWPFAEIRFL